jgi:hypothetical protein
LLYWNEDFAATAMIALAHRFHQTVEADPNSVLPKNDGRLIHLTGKITTATAALDPAFRVTGSRVLRLRRKVEMFQWQEGTDGTAKRMGGPNSTQTFYAYHRVWSESWINSSAFRQSAGHVNPVMPMKSVTFDSPAPVLGAYHLDSAVIHEISDFTPFAVRRMPPIPPYTSPFYPAKPYQLESGSLYIGWKPSNPAIGDLRVTFEAVPAQVFSLVAAQAGQTLTPFHLADGNQIMLVEPGVLSATALFADAQQEERTFALILRCIVFLVMAISGALLVAQAASFFRYFLPGRGPKR